MLGGGYFAHMLKVNLEDLTSQQIALQVPEVSLKNNKTGKADNLFNTYDLKNFTAVRSHFNYSKKLREKQVAKVLLRNNLSKFRVNYSMFFPSVDFIAEFKDCDDKIYRYKGNGTPSPTNPDSKAYKGKPYGEEVSKAKLCGAGHNICVLDNGYVLFSGGLKAIPDSEDLLVIEKASWVIWGKIFFDVTPMNVPRCYGGFAKNGKRAIIFGGLTQRSGNVVRSDGGRFGGSSAQNLKATETCEIFDFIGNTWRLLPAMPKARYNMKTAVYDNKVYLFGGFDAEDRFEEEVWCFDLNGFTWNRD